MDEVGEIRKKRRDRDREAYKNMDNEKTARFLERRRQQYANRVLQLRSELQLSSDKCCLPYCSARACNVLSSASSSVDVFGARFVRLQCVFGAAWELPEISVCQFCNAIKFFREPPSFCCGNGAVSLAPIAFNSILYELFVLDSSDRGLRFRRRVRTYNNNLALTSIGMKTDTQYCWSNHGIYTLKVNGQVSHKLEVFNSSIELPRRLQLFFLDTADDIGIETLRKYDLESDILELLLKALRENPYFRIFKRLRSWDNLQNFKVVLRADPQVNQKTHNIPTMHQVGGIWDETTDDPEDMNRDIVVYGLDSRPYRILYHYGCYDPLQYPLLFSLGEPGWHAGIERNPTSRGREAFCVGQNTIFPGIDQSAANVLDNENEVYARNRGKRTNVSCREYTAFRCQIRRDEFNSILHSGRLGQQYSIDSYIKIETQRLDFYRSEQRQMDARVESLQGIVDSLGVDGIDDAAKVGYRMILPSSFIGGPRDMMKRNTESGRLVRKELSWEEYVLLIHQMHYNVACLSLICMLSSVSRKLHTFKCHRVCVALEKHFYIEHCLLMLGQEEMLHLL